MLNKKRLKDFNYKDKFVLIRCDFNVPMDDEGNITDDNRIKASLPTIEYVAGQGGKVILLSHLGRPKGKYNKKFSLKAISERLSELLGKEIFFIPDENVISDKVKEEVSKLKEGQIALLENTRFRSEEEKNEEIFAKELSQLGEIFVNDAFGTSHRGHASNLGLATNLPSALGLLVEKEVDIIGGAISNPKRPFLAILGGAKVSDKIGVLENLLNICDSIIIGGGMAYTFIKAKGYEIGKSLLEEDRLEFAKDIMKKADEKGVKILLPIDVVEAKTFSNESEFRTVDVDSIDKDFMGLDIGPKTLSIFKEEVAKARTIIWNGPMGVFEMDNFKTGTMELAKAMAENKEAITIVGGGDSALAAEESGYADKFTHISTGGGASLELIEGKELPGIVSISNR